MKKIKRWIFEKWYRLEAKQLELIGWLEGIEVVEKIFQAVITDIERTLLLPNFSKRDREKGMALLGKIRRDLAGAVAQVVKMRTGVDIPLPAPRGKVIRLPMNEGSKPPGPGGGVPPKGEEN